MTTIDPQLPTEFTIGGRVYELVPFLKEGESSVKGDTMAERAKELGANLGKKDGAFILKHQNEIPQEFRGKIYMVFTAWYNPARPPHVACLYWYVSCWVRDWYWLGLDLEWDESARLVRRRA